ncbi:MAG TPA: hypothetical protein VGM30_24880 [Puia sp.]|jgi:hypothetical protein
MTLTKNVVALQKNLVTPPNDVFDNRITAMTIQAQLMTWGYMLDETAFTALSKADTSWLHQFYEQSVAYLRNVLGGGHNFTPLYKNFPQEVMSLTDSALFWNALRHYWSQGTWEPTSPALERPVKFEQIKYTMLTYADQDKFSNIFTTLVSLNTSLTPTDLEVVKWFAANETLVFPQAIPFKENLCTLAALGLDLPIKTPTDVLRIAVHMSGGDISLPKVPPAKIRTNRWSSVKSENPKRSLFKFRKFKRGERRYLLGLLEKTHCNPAEMVLKDQRWIRLGEILHPGEYQKKFPKTYAAFQALRNEKVQSWYGKVDEAFVQDPARGIAELSQRPGEYLRRLDSLFRKYPKYSSPILAFLAKAALSSSNKVLFELYEHFENRYKPTSARSIMIKGARKKTQLPQLPAMDSKLIETVHQVLFGALKEKFSKLEPLGNVWIDEKLKNIPLPKNMRSKDFSTRPTIRGSRIPFDNPGAKVIRPFVHWMDNRGSEDLDLSVTFIGDIKREVISYRQLRSDYALHSGDVRHRRGACAEYIDIDINKALEYGMQYAVIDVRNFEGHGLEKVECMFGLMERQYPESNNTWLPSTISSAHGLKSESSSTIIAMLDLVKREYVMIDLDSASIPVASASVADTLRIIEEYTKPPKVSVYDLLLMHTEARGRLVTLDSNVDQYFRNEQFMHSYEEIARYMI